eukprot:sb/3472312/
MVLPSQPLKYKSKATVCYNILPSSTLFSQALKCKGTTISSHQLSRTTCSPNVSNLTLSFFSIACAMYVGHYVKRVLETIFIHRFSKATMPIGNLFKNCSYYWGFSAFISYFVNHPLYTPAGMSSDLVRHNNLVSDLVSMLCLLTAVVSQQSSVDLESSILGRPARCTL